MHQDRLLRLMKSNADIHHAHDPPESAHNVSEGGALLLHREQLLYKILASFGLTGRELGLGMTGVLCRHYRPRLRSIQGLGAFWFVIA
jgi:hypothetical protein